jgi:hypothetical protein
VEPDVCLMPMSLPAYIYMLGQHTQPHYSAAHNASVSRGTDPIAPTQCSTELRWLHAIARHAQAVM